MKSKRTERQEIRLSVEEKAFIEKAAEKKGMSVSEFIRSTSVEMAEAISKDKSPEDTYHALVMSSSKIAPEILVYSASAEYTPMPERKEGNEET